MNLLIIGFDGLDYYLAREFLKKKQKPFVLKKLKTKTPLTGPSWASIYTGVEKKTHGIRSLWGTPENGSKTLEDVKEFTFWRIIKKNGFSVFTDNLPLSKEWIACQRNKHKNIVTLVYRSRQGSNTKGMPFNRAFELFKKQNHEAIKYYLKQKVDLMFVQFSFVDNLFHLFHLPKMEQQRVYKHCFEIIEKMFSKLKPRYLLVVSDHGFYPAISTNAVPRELVAAHEMRIDGCCIFNNEALSFFEKHGYLTNDSLMKRILYDFCFCGKPFSLDKWLLKLYYVWTLLKTGRITELLKYSASLQKRFFNRNLLIAAESQQKEAYLALKFNISPGIPQTILFKAILEMFQISHVPTVWKKTKTKQHGNKISKKEMELVKERLRALGYTP